MRHGAAHDAAAAPAARPDGGPLLLLRQKSVQKELGLTPETTRKIMAFTNAQSEAGRKAMEKEGAERKIAYEAVQRAAMKTWKGSDSFAQNAKRESEIRARLSDAEIDALCSLDVHLQHVEETFKAVGLE